VAALPDLVTEVNASGAYIDEKAISVGNAFQGAYSAGTTYTTGQSVLYADIFYLSLVDSNTGNTPDSSPSQWVQIVGAAGGGGGGTVDFTASGSLSNGDLVKINSDGTVSVVQGGGPGSDAVFESGSTSDTTATFDSNSNKVVIAYKDGGNSNYGTAVVGTVSGSSITFGSPTVFNSGTTNQLSATFDSLNNKIVIFYQDGANSGYGTVIVGTVSGSTISFGSETVFNAGESQYMSCTFDSNSNKVVLACMTGSPDTGSAFVGTVSGNSISFGSKVDFVSNNVSVVNATFDSNSNKVVISYRDLGNLSYGTAVVGTVSGTSISFGTPVIWAAMSHQVGGQTFDTNSNKVVIAYYDTPTATGKAIVGTVSGTSISFGTAVVFEASSATEISATFDSNVNKVVIVYRDSANTNTGRVIVGTVSGTSITFANPETYSSQGYGHMSTTFDSNSNKSVIAYQDGGNSNYGTAVTFNPSDAPDWVGFASADATDGNTATINVVSSVNEGQTGLTTGFKYYLADSGTLTTTTTSGREVGRAIAADKILITQGSIS